MKILLTFKYLICFNATKTSKHHMLACNKSAHHLNHKCKIIAASGHIWLALNSSISPFRVITVRGVTALKGQLLMRTAAAMHLKKLNLRPKKLIFLNVFLKGDSRNENL